ncbi:hypothetical protein M422DRAFT_70311 [Sphaerobolus stellatus SS14]|uniref:Uncharacterized protein n=1 Tax=Sphaerobolus stellatus (strain SS14) TaxID=990650 RepID=A0A0C9V951_SPHS4|nr:hypothetical protein M422DRAFT_70311 [Sphaerobolus stellatus SS14]
MVHPAVDYATQLALARPWQGACPSIGSVGYLLNGAWVELTNIRDKEHEFGTLQHATLHASQPLVSANVKKIKAGFGAGSDCSPAGAMARFNFQCTKEKGALLVLGDDADQYDVIKRKFFKDALKNNYEGWFRAAEDDNDELSLGDIILVTGHDKTSKWMNAVFHEGASEFSLDITLGAPGIASAAVNLELSSSQVRQIDRNWGPITCICFANHISTNSDTSSIAGLARPFLALQGAFPTADVPQTTRDQCVFLRGCKILDRQSWQKLFNYKKKKSVFTELDLPNQDDASPGGSSSNGSGSSSSSGGLGSRSSSGGSGSSSTLSFTTFSSLFLGSAETRTPSIISHLEAVECHSERNDEMENHLRLELLESSVDSDSDSSASDHDTSGPDYDSSGFSDTGEPMYEDKLRDPLLLLLMYILERCDAELAIADHYDLATLDIKDFTSPTEFVRELYELSPPILIKEGVATLALDNIFQCDSIDSLEDITATGFDINDAESISYEETFGSNSPEDSDRIGLTKPPTLKISSIRDQQSEDDQECVRTKSQEYQITPEPFESEVHGCCLNHNDYILCVCLKDSPIDEEEHIKYDVQTRFVDIY